MFFYFDFDKIAQKGKLMRLILITGKSGSGKSYLCNILTHKLKYYYIDTDKLIHNLMERDEIVVSIKQIFGSEVFENQKLDRKKIGNYLFANPNSAKTKEYYAKIMQYVESEIDELINQNNNCIIDYAFLPLLKLWNYPKTTKILVKSQNEQKRFQKLCERDNVSQEYLLKREKNMLDFDNYKFDLVFQNNYNDEIMQDFVNKVIKISNQD